MTAGKVRALTADRLLVRNAALNLFAQGAPLVAALVAVPLLIKGGGIERFALLTIAWTFVGYFSLADAGLGRALTHFVSDRIGQGKEEEIPAAAWTGIALMAGFGILGGALVWWIAPAIIERSEEIPLFLVEEGVRAFRILAVGVPIVVVSASFRGILEAVQRFGIVSAVRVPMGVLTFLGPVAILPITPGLDAAVAALVVARFLGGAAYFTFALRALPVLRRPRLPERAMVRPLLTFGGWVSVSNVVGPLMVHMDRVVIAGVFSLAAVAYYVTPFEVVTRLLIIPVGIAGVIFPAFATSFHTAPLRVASLFDGASRAILIGVLPITLVLMVAAEPGLTLWVGPDFAREGAAVVRWLAVAIFINSLAHVPYALLQAGGRPDLTARAHLIEAPLYFAALWILLVGFGVAGAAMAWLFRVLLDAVLLFVLAARTVPGCRRSVRTAVRGALGGVLLLGGAAVPVRGALSAVLLGLVLLAFGTWGWIAVLRPRHRLQALKWMAPERVRRRPSGRLWREKCESGG